MSPAELDAVLEIENQSYPRPWSRDHFLDELQSPFSFPLVALNSEGLLIGYICPMQVVDEGHILDVAVAPNYRGQGVARLLIETVLQECRRRNAELVSLEVRKSNEQAIVLYKKMGFVETGLRRRYYENGEDALLMEYLFSHEENVADAL